MHQGHPQEEAQAPARLANQAVQVVQESLSRVELYFLEKNFGVNARMVQNANRISMTLGEAKLMAIELELSMKYGNLRMEDT